MDRSREGTHPPHPPSKAVITFTNTHQLGLLFQIIEKAGSIPWDDLVLPEGRTKKACVVMVDKEKAKVRKARGGNGTAGEEGGEGGGAKVGGLISLRPRKDIC